MDTDTEVDDEKERAAEENRAVLCSSVAAPLALRRNDEHSPGEREIVEG